VYAWCWCTGTCEGHEADGEQQEGGGVEHWLCDWVFVLCSEHRVFFHSFLHPFFLSVVLLLVLLLLNRCCTRVIQCLYSSYPFCPLLLTQGGVILEKTGIYQSVLYIYFRIHGHGSYEENMVCPPRVLRWSWWSVVDYLSDVACS